MARFHYGVCWLLTVIIWTSSLSRTALAKPFKRQPLTIKFCQDLGYNTTIFPNFLRQRTQKVASLELDQFSPLVKIKCSKDLILFLCSMYAPIYSAVLMKSIPPCRSLCESAKHGCENVMQHFGFVWPEDLACNKIPKSPPNSICIASQYKNATGNTHPQARKPTRLSKRRYKKNKKQKHRKPNHVRNGSRKSSCEAVRLPLCTGQGYNETAFPNLLGHVNQAEAGLAVRQFVPLVRANCSRDLPFFLCSLYAPPCTVLKSAALPPCRSLCESAKSGCNGLLRKFNLPWPEPLECDNLPSFSSSQMCIGAGGNIMSNVSPSANTVLSNNERKKKKRKNRRRKKNRKNRRNRKNRKNKSRKQRKRRPRMMRKKRRIAKIRKLSGKKQDSF